MAVRFARMRALSARSDGSTAPRVRSSDPGHGLRNLGVTMCADAVRGDEQHDVVIIGAGVAGMSCALECFDVQLATVVFEVHERPGGQLVEIPHSIKNVAT